MPYDERDERDLDLEEQSLYEDDPAYASDTYFAERLDRAPDEEVMDEEAEDEPSTEPAFGETPESTEGAETTGKPEYTKESDELEEDFDE